MGLAQLLTQDVEIWDVAVTDEPPEYDELGELVDGYTLSETVKGRIEWETGQEFVDGRTVTVQKAVAYLMPAATVTTTSRLKIPGSEFDVEATRPVRSPRGVHHIRCDLREVT